MIRAASKKRRARPRSKIGHSNITNINLFDEEIPSTSEYSSQKLTVSNYDAEKIKVVAKNTKLHQNKKLLHNIGMIHIICIFCIYFSNEKSEK